MRATDMSDGSGGTSKNADVMTTSPFAKRAIDPPDPTRSAGIATQARTDPKPMRPKTTVARRRGFFIRSRPSREELEENVRRSGDSDPRQSRSDPAPGRSIEVRSSLYQTGEATMRLAAKAS